MLDRRLDSVQPNFYLITEVDKIYYLEQRSN